jgi:DNA-binding MarR family transcriptional regulator
VTEHRRGIMGGDARAAAPAVPRPEPMPESPEPTPAPPGWTEEESEAAFDKLGDRVIDATRNWLRSARRKRLQHELYTVDDVELSLTQIDALEILERGPVRMHELAARLHIDPSTATRTTAPLVDLGLLDRQPDPSNRRYVVMQATARGRETARRITEGRRAMMREILAPMAPERRLLLADLLEEYLALIEAHDPGA